MEKTLKVYKIGYSNDEAFPTKDTQLLINAFTYNAKRMGDTPTISCTVKCGFIPENEWTEEVYVQFNNERFYLKRTPSSVLDNTDARYKYTLDFVSERNILNNVYFFNVVYGEKEGYKAASNDVNFRFTGDIHEFVERLNYSLQYSKLQTITNDVVEGYHVVVDDDITTEYKDVEFDSQFFSNALQEVFNTYDLPYYFVGKTIHVGHHDNDSAIEEPFEYGSEHGLISVTKTSENNKIVNRISGHGSAENIPYYYPNDTPKGVMEFVTPSTNKHLQASNFVIANGERVSSTTDLISEVDAGVSAEVEFVKHTANSIHRSYSNDGKNLLKIESYSGANNAWVETTLGYGDVQDDNKCLKNNSFTGTYGTEYTITYHVRVKFIATNQDGGVLKWEWKTNPFYKTIEKQIELDGDIAYAFFKDLKAYEIINNEQVEIKPHQSETYPTSIISTAFSGSKNSDGSSTVEIHLEFTFWKARISESQLLMYGDLLYTNFTKITLETGIKDYYRWKNARNSFVSLKDMGISLTPDSVASDFEANKDKYVGEKFSLKQTEYILPTQNLMPTIYRDSKGDERFYKALNGKYVVPDRFKEELTDDVAPDGIYPFAHPYIEGKPREHMQDFEDIKPTIKEMLNGEDKRMDIFLDFAYDTNDNDEVDENGKYLHPYFFAKLPKYDGVNGFNLFDHAIESGAMQISMTDGWCAGCKFNIAVDPDTQKNVVQVDDKGYLVRDGYGNVVVKKGIAQDKQNDTRTNTVWIALEKDTESYGVVMPNKGIKNKPTPNKDTFVILNIALPKAYITAAEKKLEEELIHYMYNNNNQLFNFSIKFSRIYLAEHPEVLQKLNENSAITVVYKGIGYPLHVSSYTYKMDGNSILPEITVDLSDKLTIATNAIENAVQQAKAEFRTTVASIDYLSNSRNFFIRKDEDDTAIGHLDFEKGFTSNGNADFGKFVAGTQGASVYKDDAGNWYIESDYLRVRKKFSAKSVEVEEAHHVGGSQLLTAANCVVDFVKPITDSQGNTIAYRCFFLKEDSNGKGVTNKWKTGDQAYCKSFNLAGTNDGSNSDPDKYYWRKVVATSQDTSEEEMTLTSGDTTIITSNYHFIDLSNKDDEKDVQSDIPYTNDNIVQLGYQGTDDASRQNAIVLAGAGEGSPYIRQYMGINSFKMPEPDTQIKPGDNVFTGKISIKPGSTGLKNTSDWEEAQQEIEQAKTDAAAAKVEAGQVLGYANDAVKKAEAAQSAADTAKSDASKAQAAAQSAQTTASNAADTLNEWADDKVISPLEKQGVKDEKAFVEADKNDIDKQSERYGIKKSSGNEEVYTTFVTHYDAYLTNLTTIVNSTDDIVAIPTDMATNQTAYYTARTNLLERIAALAKKVADDAQTTATNAQNAAKAAQDTANTANAAVSNLNDTVSGLNESVSTINKRLDGVVENYFYEGDPTDPNNPNNPALQWTTETDMANHVGDTYTNIEEYENNQTTPSAGKSWRWTPTDTEHTGYHWHPIADSDAVKALLEASKAQAAADSKVRTFVNEPTPPYDKGDMWLQGDEDEGDILVCHISRAAGATFIKSDWKKASKYTDDSEFNAFKNGAYKEAMVAIQNQVDQKSETWYQAEDPSDKWTTDEEMAKHVGDLWYNTELQQNYIYNANCEWEDFKGVPQSVYDTIDGKANIFYTNSEDVLPTPPYNVGDLWSIGTEGVLQICTRSATEKASHDDWRPADNTEQLVDAAKKEQEDYTNNAINGLTSGSQNLVRNSGFTGSYEALSLQSGQSLQSSLEMYSPSLEGWDYPKNPDQAQAEKSTTSQTGKRASMWKNYSDGTLGYISQALSATIKPSTNYVVSFMAYCNSGVLNVTFGDITKKFTLTNNWKTYHWRMTSASSSDTLNLLKFEATHQVWISDIIVSEGSVPIDWSPSPYDNRSVMAKFQASEYLQEVLKVHTEMDASSVKTGLVNTGMVLMGHYEDGALKATTAGLSGTLNDDNDVAFFCGGDLEAAMYTAQTYLADPAHQPSPEEITKMAKAVITHGGRAILNQAIVRGDIYADNGYFRGTLEASAVYTKMKTLIVPSGKNIEYVIGKTDGDPIYPFYTCEQYVSQSYSGTIILPRASLYLGMELSFLPTRRPNSTLEYPSWTLLGAVNGYDEYGYERLDPIMTIPDSGYTPSIQNYDYTMKSNFKVRRFVATMYDNTAVWMELRENS